MSLTTAAMDAITIGQWLKEKKVLEKVGGYDYLVELQDSTLVPAHIEHYSEIVQEKYLRRRLIEKSVDMIESAYRDEHEASVIIGEAESSLFDLSGNKDDKFPDWKDSVRSVFTDIENQDPNELISGVTTGYIGLNERLGGLKPTDMIVIAARPAMGKTSLALNIAENAALGLHGEPIPVGVFSLEMSREQLVKRMLFSHAKLSSERMRGRRMTMDESMRG